MAMARSYIKKKRKDTEEEYYSSFGNAHFNLILDIFISWRRMEKLPYVHPQIFTPKMDKEVKGLAAIIFDSSAL